jgi:xanthine dehydrogenase YagR molybdenum-binding subunit
VVHQALEPHGSVVWWQGDRVTVYDSTQGIFRVRRQLAAYLGLRSSQVRVIAEHIGGGFGSKNDCGSYTVLAALLSKRTRRPVKVILDRAEEVLDTGHRPATVMRLTIAAGRDGQLSAIDFEAWIAMGADGWAGGPGQLMHRMYRCANVRTVEHFVYTNTGPMSAFRAPFYVEGAFALESGMDLMAKRLRLDPIELRMRNLAQVDQERGRPYSTNGLPECYAEVARRIGWEKRKTTSRNPASKRVRRGIGVAAQLWGAGGGPPAYAEVRINRDGTALVATGTQDLGTGSRTILAQIAAEVLGLELSQVRVVLGDTDAGPYAGNSWGSMTTASVGPAVRMAADDARRLVCEVAAALIGVSPDRMTLRRGRVRVRGGRKSIAIERVTEHLGNIMIVGRGHRGPNPESVTVASFGAQAAEVEVDIETGVVRVLRIVAAHDCGRVINPELAESQLHGGIIQGLGYVLFERLVQDPTRGTVLNAGLHDYKIPTLVDVPSIDARVISHGDPMANHTGAKGLAEPPIIPTAPAVANAVYDALGVQPTSLPLTPATVLELIKKRRRRP